MNSGAWDRAELALQLLALDPYGLGGAQVRMRAGAQRDTIVDAFRNNGIRDRLPPNISDDQLLGGLDLTATLAEGKVVHQRAYFETPRSAFLPMSERCSRELAARLEQVLDNQKACLICLDEGLEAEEQTPPALLDRLAFRIDPDTREPSGWHAPCPTGMPGAAHVSDDQIEALVRLAFDLGIDSLRAPLLAVAAAKAHARLQGRAQVTKEDVSVAAAMVLAHRATRLPEQETDQPDEPAQHHDADEQADAGRDDVDIPTEMLIEAVQSALPNGLLATTVPAGTRNQQGTGFGGKRVSKRRGRPLPPRPGRLDGRARIDIVATLRAAAPWQKMRPRPPGDKLAIYASDIRIKRFEERSDRLLVFTVDASGSAAVARLGEAKGAVEMLLADAYASRDHVALVAFRGQSAELLLPPTRSLVQTKRRLASLPGGGGTPLAAGLQEANKVIQQARGRGMSPTLVLLTDGRANVALNGATDRGSAQTDATKLALTMRGTAGLVIDTGNRPSSALQALSQTMDTPYLAMPRADAYQLASALCD